MITQSKLKNHKSHMSNLHQGKLINTKVQYFSLVILREEHIFTISV